MLGVSVDFPAARRSARHAHLAAMPPSTQASSTRWPSTRPVLRSRAFHRWARIEHAATLELGGLRVLVLVDEVLVDAEVHQLGGSRGSSQVWQKVARFSVRCRRAAVRPRSPGTPRLAASPRLDSAATGGRQTCPGRRRRVEIPSRTDLPRATAWRASWRVRSAVRRRVPYPSRAGLPVRAELASSCRRPRPSRTMRRRSLLPVRGRSAAREPGSDDPPTSIAADAAPWCGSGTPGSRPTPSDLSDLGEGQAVVVVHHQHRALAVGHGGHGGHEGLLGLLGLEGVDRAPGTVGQRFAERASARTGPHLAAPRRAPSCPPRRSRAAPCGTPRCSCPARPPPRRRSASGAGSLRGASPPARRPVPWSRTDRGTQSIDRSSSMIALLDAGDGIGLEPQVPVDLEALDGVDQPDDPVADQILLVEVPWKAGQDPAGHVLDEGASSRR